MYFRFGLPDTALHLFDEMRSRNDASWNTAISGCVRAGRFAEAVALFKGMRENEICLNGFVLASLVTACTRWSPLAGCGFQFHGFVSKLGLMCNVYVTTALLHLYGSSGLVGDARRFFEEMPERNVVSWTALMLSCSTNGHPEEALRAYEMMRREGVVCNENSFATVISACGSLENERPSLQVLAHVVVSGYESEVSVANSLITLFGNLGRVEDAEWLFDRMKNRDRISWNSIISVYSREGMCEESLECFAKMRYADVKPDFATVSSLISVCARADYLEWGRAIHGLVARAGLDSFVSVSNTLINLYSASGRSEDSERLFHSLHQKDLISWNTMISVFSQNGEYKGALRILAKMIRRNIETNHVTFASALAACSISQARSSGRMVHALIFQFDLQENRVVGNALITMYSAFNDMREAAQIFQTMPERDVVTWNTLIGGHVENSEAREVIQAFNLMREVGTRANYITMINVLGACSAPHDLMNYGMPLHAHVISTGFELDEYVKNSLLTMYAKCGDFDSSGFIFNLLPIRTAVSWNVMIAAKAQHGRGEDAFKLLMEMHHVGMELDRFSLCGGLTASASLTSLQEGQQIHGLLIKLGFDSDLPVANAAMDMYAKCGNLDEMLKVRPSPADCSRQSWNIIISGYARHGCFENAKDSFHEMLRLGEKPDYITFISLLSACNHAGLVDSGLDYYNSMASEFGILPRIEHCVCVVDLLGRSGRLTEAERFIEDMPVSPNDRIWRSLLASSRTQKNLEVGMKAAKRLLELDPLDDSAYVLLSNVYATSGRWKEVERLRTHMNSINLIKKPAYSWIKVKNKVRTFAIGDRTHPETREIYEKLEEVLQAIKRSGYIADTSFALHDTDEEQKENNLWKHSEKLALAFGLVSMPEGYAIRVSKNLRVCGDCHLVYKLVSKAFDREIVLQDPYRFHHFKEGECSCSDYW